MMVRLRVFLKRSLRGVGRTGWAAWMIGPIIPEGVGSAGLPGDAGPAAETLQGFEEGRGQSQEEEQVA
jgi:hypothetical protein